MRSIAILLVAVVLAACGAPTNSNSSNASNAAANSSPAAQTLSVVDTPQRVKDLMASRGEQDRAAPTLKIVSPAEGLTINNPSVQVKLELSGDLKGYKPHKDPETGTGNHIHVILDNEPYEAYYNIDEPFELRNLSNGEHTLRVFASRPWHESYKNEGSFQMVRFTMNGTNSNSNQPVTTNDGQQMSNVNSNSVPNREGKTYSRGVSQEVTVDAGKPLLTYSRPKGEYKGAESDPVMIDFWLASAKLKGDGGTYRVRYSVDNGEAKYIDKWAPVWLSGWTAGKHTIKLELIDEAGTLVDNGGYNSTTREIMITK